MTSSQSLEGLRQQLAAAEEENRQLVARLAALQSKALTSSLPSPTAVLDSITDAFVAFDKSFRYVWVNTAAESLLNLTRDQLLGRTPFELFPDSPREGIEALQRAMQYREAVEFENFYPTWNRWYFNKVYPTNDGGLAVYWRDITQEKQSAAEIARHAAVLQQVHDSIITTDLRGSITGWNHGAENIFGYAAPEILGQSIAVLYFPEDRQGIEENILQPLMENGHLELNLRNRRRSGDECFIRLSLSLLRDSAGSPYAMLGVAADLTEQTLATRALRESEARYRGLANAIPQIVYITDAAGRTTFINDQWLNFSGTDPAHSTDLQWMNWIHPDDLPALQALWTTCVATSQPFDAEYRVRNRHGEYRWQLSRAVPVLDPDGNILSWAGSLTDIHDSRVAEAEQRTLTEQLRLAIKATGAVVYDGDLATGVAQIRGDHPGFPGSEQTTSITRDQWIARMHPDDLAEASARMDAAMTEGRSTYHLEYRMRQSDADWVCISDRGSILRDVQGKPVRLVGSLVDITESRELLDRLSFKERLLNAIGESVIAIDDDQRIRFCNSAAAQMYGFDCQDVIGKPLSENHSWRFLSPDDEAKAYADLAEKGTWSGENIHIRKDGTSFHVSSTVTRLPDSEGGGMIAVIRDISDRTRMEAELARHAADLDRANQDLIHSSQAVAHDLKAPLRNVANFAQLLYRRSLPVLDSESRQLLDIILAGAKRVSTMVDDLMLVAQAAGEPLRTEPVRLTEPLHEALQNLVSLTTDTGATITCGDLPVIAADRSQLTQLFQNLLGNAIKYRKPGTPPHIVISAQPRASEWLITIQDNGVGFEPGHAGRIFDVFARLNPNTAEGSGVGLTICKRIVERHGGRIWATGTPNEGATLAFTLPAIQ